VESSRAEACYIWMEVKPVVTSPKGNFPLFSFWHPNLNSSQVDLISDESGGNSQLKSKGSMGTCDPQTGWPLYLAKVSLSFTHSIFEVALQATCFLVHKQLSFHSKSLSLVYRSQAFPYHLASRFAEFWHFGSLFKSQAQWLMKYWTRWNILWTVLIYRQTIKISESKSTNRLESSAGISSMNMSKLRSEISASIGKLDDFKDEMRSDPKDIAKAQGDFGQGLSDLEQAINKSLRSILGNSDLPCSFTFSKVARFGIEVLSPLCYIEASLFLCYLKSFVVYSVCVNSPVAVCNEDQAVGQEWMISREKES